MGVCLVTFGVTHPHPIIYSSTILLSFSCYTITHNAISDLSVCLSLLILFFQSCDIPLCQAVLTVTPGWVVLTP